MKKSKRLGLLIWLLVSMVWAIFLAQIQGCPKTAGAAEVADAPTEKPANAGQQNRLNHLVKYWMQDYIDSRTEFEVGVVVMTRYYFPVTVYVTMSRPNEMKTVHTWHRGRVNMNAFARIARGARP